MKGLRNVLFFTGAMASCATMCLTTHSLLTMITHLREILKVAREYIAYSTFFSQLLNESFTLRCVLLNESLQRGHPRSVHTPSLQTFL